MCASRQLYCSNIKVTISWLISLLFLPLDLWLCWFSTRMIPIDVKGCGIVILYYKKKCSKIYHKKFSKDFFSFSDNKGSLYTLYNIATTSSLLSFGLFLLFTASIAVYKFKSFGCCCC